jgi:hypothetical protein
LCSEAVKEHHLLVGTTKMYINQVANEDPKPYDWRDIGTRENLVCFGFSKSKAWL